MTWTKPSHHLFSLFCLNLDFWPFMHLKMQNSPRSSKSEIKSEVSSAALWSRDAGSQLWSAAPGINAIKGFRVWERSGLMTRRCCMSAAAADMPMLNGCLVTAGAGLSSHQRCLHQSLQRAEEQRRLQPGRLLRFLQEGTAPVGVKGFITVSTNLWDVLL